jgi:hypothetical protein
VLRIKDHHQVFQQLHQLVVDKEDQEHQKNVVHQVDLVVVAL